MEHCKLAFQQCEPEFSTVIAVLEIILPFNIADLVAGRPRHAGIAVCSANTRCAVWQTCDFVHVMCHMYLLHEN